MPKTMGDLTLGIRPEHVVRSPAGDAGLEAVKELVEPTGYGIILHLTLAEEVFKVLTHDIA